MNHAYRLSKFYDQSRDAKVVGGQGEDSCSLHQTITWTLSIILHNEHALWQEILRAYKLSLQIYPRQPLPFQHTNRQGG